MLKLKFNVKFKKSSQAKSDTVRALHIDTQLRALHNLRVSGCYRTRRSVLPDLTSTLSFPSPTQC